MIYKSQKNNFMKNKIVYVPLAVDFLHSGHFNILNVAQKYGDIVVGILTDKIISQYKDIPLLSFEQRYKIIKSLKVVKTIIKQDSLDYSIILNKIKPDFFVHGDDWKKGNQKTIRANVIRTLKKNKGKLIEVPYTKNIPDELIKEQIKKNFLSNSRVSLLKRMIEAKNIVRILETHNPLCGLIVEKLKYLGKERLCSFDGMWSSSLTDSVSRAKPDNQSVDYSTRIYGVNSILSLTTKPLLFDIDNGGQINHLKFIINDLEKSGVSGIVMEDKIGFKKNSLFDDQTSVKQDSIFNFCKKIEIAKKFTINKDFLIIARIESLILGKSIKDAIKRAEAYSKAGADAILIHSKQKNPHEIFKFAKIFKESNFYKPMIAIPSTYSKTYEKDLIKNGFKVVIYANQLLRASYKSMYEVAKKILVHQRSFEVEKNITSIKDIISLIS